MEATSLAECAICIEVYRNPNILRCSHTFCKDCIDGLRKGTSVKCPLCNSYTEITAVKPNYALTEALQGMKQMEERLKEQSELLQGKPVEVSSSNNSKCGLCSKGNVAFRCVDCAEWICDECKNIHKKMKATSVHSLQLLSDCNLEARSTMNKTVNTLKTLYEQYGFSSERFKEEINSLHHMQALMLKKSSELREQIIDEINRKFHKLDSEINQICTDKIQTLQEYYDGQCKQMEMLATCLREMEITIENKNVDLAIAGQTSIAEAEELIASLTPDVYSVKLFLLEVFLTQSWKSEEIVVIQQSGGDINSKKSDPALSGLLDKLWKLEKLVRIPKYPHSLRQIDDQLWQCHANGISVFTLDLEPVTQMFSGDYINDVANTGQGEVVFATESGLFSGNKNGEEKTRINGGSFTCVCFYDGQLFAAQFDSNTVRIYRRSGSTWKQRSNFRVPRGTASLWVNSAGVFIGIDKHNMFYHYSYIGELLSRNGLKGRKSLNTVSQSHSLLCGVDSEGAALLFEGNGCSNQRMVLLTRGGKRRDLRILAPLVSPKCALFYNARLYLHTSHDCIYMFSELK